MEPSAQAKADFYPTQALVATADADFVELAWPELLQASAGARPIRTLAPGVQRFELAEPFAELAERWRIAPPIFVRHIQPVQWELPLAGVPADVEMVASLAVAEIAPHLAAGWPLSVQTRILASLPYRPFDLNRAVADALVEQTGVAVDVRAPAQVLSIVCTPAPDGAAWIGLSAAAHNLSNWVGGMRRFAREEGQISRSEFKLLEALEVFAIDMPPRGVVLDLGAAPGGWTRVLRRLGQYVTAIDPGDLDPRLAADSHIRHRRVTAERFLAEEHESFDFIVNDMRMDARDSARLMAAYAGRLYPHGGALMTLKLPEQNRRAVIDHAFAILREAYTIAGARQLFHNRSEISVYLRPLASSARNP